MQDKEIARVEHLILNTTAISEFLHKNYSLGRQIACVLEKSAPSAVYRIEVEEGTFALKLYNSMRPYEFEREFVTFLHRKGVNVASLISTDSGAPFFSTSCCGTKLHGVLHHYIDGRDPAHDESEDAIMYGQELARLHEASLDFKPKVAPPEFDPVKRLEADLECVTSVLKSLERRNALAQYQTAAKSLRERLVEGRRQFQSNRFLHGDSHGGNAKILRGKMSFFDFELACRGPLEWDIACFRWASIIGKREKSYENFLTGYKNVAGDIELSDAIISNYTALKEMEVVSNHLGMSKILGSWFITDRYLKMRLNAMNSGRF